MASACLVTPGEAAMARPFGTRKFRAYPGATSTRSPLLPRLATSARSTIFTLNAPYGLERLVAEVVVRRGGLRGRRGGARPAPAPPPPPVSPPAAPGLSVPGRNPAPRG